MRASPTWIFDLDNTLHDARPHIFPHINRSMTAYIEAHLRLDERDADALRREYWRRYGATLLGMVRHHQTDPAHFLWHTHQFPDLARMVVAERGLVHALARLRGRKIVFSNGPLHYALAVLEILGLDRFFDAVYTIEHVGYRPKPGVEAFRAILRQERVDPRRCIMVEDLLRNLRTAKRLGMKTVWVSREARSPGFVDARVGAIGGLPRIFRQLFNPG